MTYLRYCTLTGLDESTDLNEVARLSAHHQPCEWGVLFSRSRMEAGGGQGRYPREAWIREFADFAEKSEFRTAIHLCGKDALDFIRGDDAISELAGQFGRIQLNVKADGLKLPGNLGEREVSDAIRNVHAMGWNTRAVIMQYNAANAELCQALRQSRGFESLVDASGGRGQLPDSWEFPPHHFFGMRIGMAGGLGPDNIADQLPLIAKGAQGKMFWVDMESKLRNAEDRFDLSACEKVLDATAQWQYELLCAHGAKAAQRDKPETDVIKLDGFYLNWWAGLASGYPMTVPPDNAGRPTYLGRTYGDYESFTPLESAHELNSLVEEFGVGCIKKPGSDDWTGMTSDGQTIAGPDRKTAMLRAVVLEAFGPTVQSNPADEPFLHTVWLGDGAGPDMCAKKTVSVRP